jgi:DNA invertase Pin-like site-specific DNA recombinase
MSEGKLVGYARVSTVDQDQALQLDALAKAGVDDANVYTDKCSGKLTARPGLDKALAALEPCDKLVIWKLDRLGRRLAHLIAVAEDLRSRGIDLVITTMGVDTSTAAGRFFYNVIGAVAEFERELIRERTLAYR